MNTNQILDERARMLNALGHKLNEQKDTPDYVIRLFGIAQNFSNFAMQIETLRLSTLLTARDLANDTKLTNKRRVEKILQFVQGELNKEIENKTNDTGNQKQINNSIPPSRGGSEQRPEA